MLKIATCLWDANEHSPENSRCFDYTWVDKLYRGFRKNLTVPFEFFLFTDRGRTVNVNVNQVRLETDDPDFGSMIEPFKMGGPLIVCGLDTVVVGNVDHLARYCFRDNKLGLPRDPYQPDRSINAIALVPSGHTHVWREWRGQNDMDWLRNFQWSAIDDFFPGQVASAKYHLGVAKQPPHEGPSELPEPTRIVYFHGKPKPHELGHLPWVKEHWV